MSRPRIAVLCDFVEDNWHSMDLVADMLLERLEQDYGDEFQAVRVCPPMKPRFPFNGASRKIDQAVNRHWDYPRHLRRVRDGFDLYQVVDHSYAQLALELPPERTVVFCHDLDAFRCLIEPEKDPRSPLFRALARRILTGLQRASRVLCGSAATRDEVLRHKLVPEEKITVVSYGVHPACSPDPDPASDTQIAHLLGPVTAESMDILHVGSTAPRKRIDTLLRVFARVRELVPHARLIRVGGPFTIAQQELAAALKLHGAVAALPFLDRPALSAVYRRAQVTLQPSAAEGFGLPVIEAMACGTPVIASDLPVLREVGGSAAWYCPVDDVDAWTKQVLEIARMDSLQRPAMRTRAIEHAGQYTWRAATARITEVYRGMLRSGHPGA